MLDANTISLVASATSIVLALLAIIFTVWFFVLSKKTEKETSNSLTKIETQADSLQKISGRWMDRLTKYVTTDKPSSVDPTLLQLGNMFTQLPQTIAQFLSQTQIQQSSDKITLTNEQFYTASISIYFYSAQANYWCQPYLPKAGEFDKDNPTHNLIRRIIDVSHYDFMLLHSYLTKENPDQLRNNKNYGTYIETRDSLAPYIKSVSDIYIMQQQSNVE